MAGVISRPVVDLGLSDAGAAVFTPSDFGFDYSVAGLPFLAATSDKYPYERVTLQARKQQFDTSDEAGEQTLENWWVRSQRSFNGGAGLTFLDMSDEVSGIRFHSSVGVDVWDPDRVTLLPRANIAKASTGSVMLGAAVNGTTDCWYQLSGETVTLETGAASTEVTGFTDDPGWLAVAAGTVLVCHKQGIDSFAVGGTTPANIWTQSSGTTPKAWWVKQRIIATRGPDVYELTLAGGDLDAATPVYSHPDASWTWTSAASAPGAILLGGYSGAQSSVFKLTLEDGGAVPVLDAATTACDLPEGEVLHALYVYLGTYVALGTNRGARIGVVDSGGDILYGPLTLETDAPVKCFHGEDRFVRAGYTNAINGYSGLARIDLGTEVAPGRYAWASDLQTHVVGTVGALSTLGASGRLVIGVDASGSYLETTAELESQGWLRTAGIRFGTTEAKHFKSVQVRTEPLRGQVSIGSLNTAGVETTLFTIPLGATFDDEVGVNVPPAEYLSLRFTLFRNPSDVSLGGNLLSYRLKALPAVERKELIRVPMLCFDFEEDPYGVQRGYDGSALVRFLDLRDAVATGDTVSLRDLTSGEALTCVVEELRFSSSAPTSRKTSGFGGVINMTVRTV